MSILGRRSGDESDKRDGAMSLREHLYELRRRMFYAVLAVFLGTVAGFIWFSVGIPVLRIASLGDILTGPYCAVPSPPRLDLSGDGSCQLLATSAFSPLQLRLRAAIMAGFVLTCPIWLYQIWAFVGPALYTKEKRYALGFTSSASVLFAGGMVLAYLVFPEALNMLLRFGGDFIVSGLDPEKYYSFLMGLMVIFGVSLELPLLLVMLNFAGVIKGAKLAQARRYAFFGLVVFSGIAVPGNDPLSMSVLALALCILYEVAVQVAKSHDRRKEKRRAAELAGLDDETASELGEVSSEPAAEPIAAPAPTPVAEAKPIAPSGRWDDVT